MKRATSCIARWSPFAARLASCLAAASSLVRCAGYDRSLSPRGFRPSPPRMPRRARAPACASRLTGQHRLHTFESSLALSMHWLHSENKQWTDGCTRAMVSFGRDLRTPNAPENPMRFCVLSRPTGANFAGPTLRRRATGFATPGKRDRPAYQVARRVWRSPRAAETTPTGAMVRLESRKCCCNPLNRPDSGMETSRRLPNLAHEPLEAALRPATLDARIRGHDNAGAQVDACPGNPEMA
jgi:hypothetical protein